MSINLLPVQLRSRRKQAHLNSLTFLVVVITLGAIALGDIALVTLRAVLESNVRSKEALIEQVEAEIRRFSVLGEQVSDLKQRADTLEGLYEKRREWTLLLGQLTAALPSNVILSSFSANLSSTPNVSANAKAPSIRDAEKMRASLEAAKAFKNVALGGYTVTETEGVSFAFTAELEGLIPDATPSAATKER